MTMDEKGGMPVRLKIFMAHHQTTPAYVANDIFAPVFSTPEAPAFAAANPGTIDGTLGDNLADQVPFADMRAQYFVWRNLLPQLDMVGCLQYRRTLFLSTPSLLRKHPLTGAIRASAFQVIPTQGFTLTAEMYDAYIDILRGLDAEDRQELTAILGGWDIVTVRPEHMGITMGQQYGQGHDPQHWDLLVDVVRANPWYASRPWKADLDTKTIWFHNMYVMRAALFDEYMTFWWQIVEAVRQRLAIPDDPHQMRVFGFMSERLFTIFLLQKMIDCPELRVQQVPVLVRGA